MNRLETTKLFWGEYLYKLSVKNRLASIFRDRNLSHARQVLDRLQQEYEKGLNLYYHLGSREKPITEDHFFDAKRLYSTFNKTEGYKIRVESNTLSIYSNDIVWIEKLSADLDPDSLISLHKPDPNFIDSLTKNTILVEENFGYEFKVTFGYRRGSPEFAQWADRNPKLIKLGKKAKETLLNNGYVSGMYFYARDERTLQLCNLMLSNISRIDKLIVKQDIDK